MANKCILNEDSSFCTAYIHIYIIYATEFLFPICFSLGILKSAKDFFSQTTLQYCFAKEFFLYR